MSANSRTGNGGLLHTHVADAGRADEATERYRFLFEQARDIIIFLDLSGRIVDANQAAVAAYGYSLPELLSKTIRDLRIPETIPSVDAQMRRADFIGGLFETIHRRKNGTTFPVEVSSQGATMGGRRLLLSIVRDISERKSAERALAQEEQRYRILFDQLVEAFAIHEIICDELGQPRDYRFLDVNPAFERMTGLSRGQVIGRRVLEVIPNLEKSWIETYGRVALTGETARFESYSSELGRHYEVVAFRPEAGQFATLFWDITQRTLAEEERDRLVEIAAARAAQLQSVLDNMVDSVFVADQHGKMTLTNESAMRLLGMTSQDDAQRELEDLPGLLRIRDTEGNSIAASSLPLSRALAGETVNSFDLIMFNAAVERDIYTRTNASPLRDRNGSTVGAVALTRDVTELTALDRLKDQFITVAAHELKTPVAVMKGYAQLLLSSPRGLTASQLRHLEAINRGSDRINRIVNDLLEISRFQLGHIELHLATIELGDFVPEITKRFAGTVSTHGVVVSGTTNATVRGDKGRIERVMINLLDNAVRYSRIGSDVEVALSVRGREAVITVSDRGIGIPQEKQPRIFDIFYRAHTGTAWDYGGMGVGLYISRETAAMHGGRIWFDSQESHGSSFHFCLPLEAQDARS